MVSASLIALAFMCLIHLMIGLFVLLKNKQDKANQFFFGFVLSIIGWLITNYFSNDASINVGILLAFNTAIFVFPALSAFFVLGFSLMFTELIIRVPRWLRITALTLAIAVTGVSATSLVVKGVTFGGGGVVGLEFGPAIPAYFAYLVAYF